MENLQVSRRGSDRSRAWEAGASRGSSRDTSNQAILGFGHGSHLKHWVKPDRNQGGRGSLSVWENMKSQRAQKGFLELNQLRASYFLVRKGWPDQVTEELAEANPLRVGAGKDAYSSTMAVEARTWVSSHSCP